MAGAPGGGLPGEGWGRVHEIRHEFTPDFRLARGEVIFVATLTVRMILTPTLLGRIVQIPSKLILVWRIEW